MTKKHGVFLIVDEVQTGFGATGSFWAHEKWELAEPADFVTFSKKAQASGFYHTRTTRPKHAYQQYNTWLVRPHLVWPGTLCLLMCAHYLSAGRPHSRPSSA